MHAAPRPVPPRLSSLRALNLRAGQVEGPRHRRGRHPHVHAGQDPQGERDGQGCRRAGVLRQAPRAGHVGVRLAVHRRAWRARAEHPQRPAQKHDDGRVAIDARRGNRASGWRGRAVPRPRAHLRGCLADDGSGHAVAGSARVRAGIQDGVHRPGGCGRPPRRGDRYQAHRPLVGRSATHARGVLRHAAAHGHHERGQELHSPGRHSEGCVFLPVEGYAKREKLGADGEGLRGYGNPRHRVPRGRQHAQHARH
mmetsp:Transcript_10264/g.47157  ORF Transcript_10264/g.47157 Transcript_10264/m.47157 type:complete len:253 (+) Transcript_10264:2266-3024(+)